MTEQKRKKINLENLSLDLCYTIEEFELINKQLKSSSIELNGKPVDLFEFDVSGKLIPMPQATVVMEAVVGEIVGQLSRWNVWTQQNGIITTSQGGYDFNVGGQRKIDAPDVGFLTREVYNRLTQQQRQTFQGAPFSPIFAVEVADVSGNAEFQRLDRKIKDDYFANESSVRLAWLIDPVNKEIHLYRRGMRRYPWGWRDIGGGDVLPGFRLEVWKIDEVIEDSESESSESSSSQESESSQGTERSNGSEMLVSAEGSEGREILVSTEGSEGSEMLVSTEGSEGSEMLVSTEGSERSTTSSSSESSESVDCPKCDESFDDYYDFMKHFEDEHVRLRRRRVGN